MKYEPVIGFEIHSELLTESKIFCGCANKFGAPPNTNVCPICLGMPGVLPVLNKKAIEFTIRTAISLNCNINPETAFDRKNYYYPDLPKNYQISQNYSPLGKGGWLDITVDGKVRRVNINNVHLEEDAGKLFHPVSLNRTGKSFPELSGKDRLSLPEAQDFSEQFRDLLESLVDLNRAGTPLIEIVTEPEIHSLKEAQIFMEAMRNLLLYIEVSDCKMEEGSLRFELNISVREAGDKKLPDYRVEIKNLNSMKSVLRAGEYEFNRQSKLLSEGKTPDSETRLWDDGEGVTRTMRSKETAKDYRYFPEPDLVKVVISEEWKEEIRKSLPELKDAKKKRFIEDYQLPEYDAEILTSSKALADYFEATVKIFPEPKSVSNWIMSEMMRELNQREMGIENAKVSSEALAEMLSMITSGKISGKIAKSIFPEMMDDGKKASILVSEKGLVQISDEGELDRVIQEILDKNQDAVSSYRSGKTKSFGFLVGEVMKVTKGKANPQIVNQILKNKLSG